MYYTHNLSADLHPV